MSDVRIDALIEHQREAEKAAVPAAPQSDVAAVNFNAGVAHGLRIAVSIMLKEDEDKN
jgi:hypothetical protein